MIGYLRGKVRAVNFETVTIDVGGIGYCVHMSVRDVANLKIDQELELVISEAIREQSYDLYGFFDAAEQLVFDQLLKVSGVGPRIGLALLGIGQKNELLAAIGSDEPGYLTRAPGVGKKLAEKIIIELRDKVPQFDVVESGGTSLSSNSIDAEAALRALGFKTGDIQSMMDGVDKSLSIEEQIKEALKRK